jgi:hypothetical protein
VVAFLDIGNLLCIRTGDSVDQLCGPEIDVDSWALTVVLQSIPHMARSHVECENEQCFLLPQPLTDSSYNPFVVNEIKNKGRFAIHRHRCYGIPQPHKPNNRM